MTQKDLFTRSSTVSLPTHTQTNFYRHWSPRSTSLAMPQCTQTKRQQQQKKKKKEWRVSSMQKALCFL